jgi:alkylation response protein AidB-like acyl-CoA dehydrogenase
MHFAFTDDQKLFAEGLRDLLCKECAPARVRAAWDSGRGHDTELWSHLASMGVLGVLVPEAMGGFGGTDVDLVLLLEELGRAAAPGPVLEHAGVVAPALAGTEWARALADGTTVATASLDGSFFVPHAQVCDLVLTLDGVLATNDATLTDVDGIDGGRRLFTVDGGSVTEVVFDADLAFDRGALAAAAYLVGLAERMIEVAADYAREREQYGTPIGAHQAVKHLLADALLKVEFARPAVYRASWSVAVGEPTRARDVSMAKAFASDAAYRATRSSMQVHGAIGYTWEADLQLWMKKAWALQRAWGDATFHRRRVARSVLQADDRAPLPRG